MEIIEGKKRNLGYSQDKKETKNFKIWSIPLGNKIIAKNDFVFFFFLIFIVSRQRMNSTAGGWLIHNVL